jgi:DNA repair protein RadD
MCAENPRGVCVRKEKPPVGSPNGGRIGKTAVFSHIAKSADEKQKRVIILVHRQELLNQASASLHKLGVSHGIISPKFSASSDRIQVASVQTLVRRLDRFTSPDLIIVDECFPAGTMIGEVPIEKIKVGDEVDAFDYEENKLVRRRVVRLFKNAAPNILYRIRSDGRTIVCTAGHPFLDASKNWVIAKEIKKGVFLYGLPNLFRPEENKEIEKLRSLLPEQDGREEPARCPGKNANKKSDEDPFQSNQDGENVKKNWAQTPDSWWEWTRSYGSSKTFSESPKTSDGVCFTNRDKARIGLSNALQTRHCVSKVETLHRGRRIFSLSFVSQKTRCEKRSVPCLFRVDSVEVLEQGGSREYESVCPDGQVYNFEVEDVHTYTANNFIVHNCHHGTSKTYRDIFSAFPAARLLLVTATPCRSDGQGLGVKSGGIADTMILGPSMAELMKLGFLSRARVFAPPIGIDLTGVPKRMGDYDKTELANRIDKPTITGSAVEHYLRLCKGQPAIAFCVSVKHAEHVANEFRNAGIRAVRVDGKMDDSTRKNAIEGLGTGKVDLLTSADLIGEGLDIPSCSAVLLLRPTFSKSLHLQQIGRALRVAPNKPHATILDHVGNIMRHGFPDDEQNWELDPERDERRKQKRDLDLTVRIEQCPECFFVYELGPTFCPSCGSEKASKERKIRVAEGQLEELKKEEMERAKIATRREQGEAQTVEELTELGKKRGYANPRFWAERILNGRKRK